MSYRRLTPLMVINWLLIGTGLRRNASLHALSSSTRKTCVLTNGTAHG
jgi:hypothetical protein